MSKYLIINADDFGMSKVFNEVILDLIKGGFIFSTTVMIDRVMDGQRKQIEELISLSKKNNLSVGLHLEFEVCDYPAQIESQFQKFKEIFGFVPSHIDIHKADGFEESFPDVAKFCKENNIPMRSSGIIFEGVKSTHSGAFFGSIDDFNLIKEWIATFEDGKYYEILFHPGKYDPDCKSMLNNERERDAEYVKKLNSILEENDIKLVSYFDLRN